jgi:AcrR family transcriptional regulator
VPRVDEKHLLARRRQIMEAALNCFSRQGFHRTTMVDIIDEAGVSAGSIYRYFDSKEAIVAAIAEEHHAPEATVLAAVTDDDDIRDVLHELARVSLGRLDDPKEQRWRRITVQLWAEALRNETVMGIVRQGLEEPVAALARLFATAQQRGMLAEGAGPHALAQLCASIFQGLVLQQAWDPSVDVSAYMDAVDVIVGSLVRAECDQVS